MTKKRQDYPEKDTLPHSMLQSEPESLKDNPDGETVCSPYFSNGCINEDIDTSAPNREDDENEKY